MDAQIELECETCGAPAGEGCFGLVEGDVHDGRTHGLPEAGLGPAGALDLDGDGIVAALDFDDPAAWW